MLTLKEFLDEKIKDNTFSQYTDLLLCINTFKIPTNYDYILNHTNCQLLKCPVIDWSLTNYDDEVYVKINLDWSV